MLDAIFLEIEKVQVKVNIYNLGTDEYCEITDSMGCICRHLKLDPHLTYSGGERGWMGDNPFIFLDTAYGRALGWRLKLTIRQGIINTLEYLGNNQWLLNER